MKKLPKYEIINKVKDRYEFKPFKVTMVSIGSFFKYDNYLYIEDNPTIAFTTSNINIKSEYHLLKGTSVDARQIHLPVVSFGGTLVLLMDNIEEDHKHWLYNNNVVPTVYNKSSRVDNAFIIDFYDVQDPDILTELNKEGMNQIELFYAASEEYLCAKIAKYAALDDILVDSFNPLEDKPFIKGKAEDIALKIGLPILK